MIKKEDSFKIGEVSKTHHLQGAVIISTDNDLLEKYSQEPLFLLLDGAPVPFFIADNGNDIRPRNHNSYIVKFDFIDNINQAESLLGSDLLIAKSSLNEEDFSKDDFDIYDLIDFKIVDKTNNIKGLIEDVVNYSGNIVLILNINNKEVLLPLNDNFIEEIDVENHLVHLNIPKELLDLN